MIESFPSADNKEANPILQEKSVKFEDFPWGAAGLGLYKEFKKDSPDAPEKVEAVKEILNTFLDQEVENIRIYESDDHRASFPYTVIKVKDLAEALYSKYSPNSRSGNELPSAETKEEAQNAEVKKRVEFIMTSVPATFHGHPFTFAEFAIHKAMTALTNALKAMERGEEPENIENIHFWFSYQ